MSVVIGILLITMLAAGIGGVYYYYRQIINDGGDFAMINMFKLIVSAALAITAAIVLVRLYLSGEF
jgi:hypothetical protein